MDAHTAFKTGQNLKLIVNESFAVINKCIEQFDTFRDLIRDELLQRTHFAGISVSTDFLKIKRKDQIFSFYFSGKDFPC